VKLHLPESTPQSGRVLAEIEIPVLASEDVYGGKLVLRSIGSIPVTFSM
jgi:hypothetical protein